MKEFALIKQNCCKWIWHIKREKCRGIWSHFWSTLHRHFFMYFVSTFLIEHKLWNYKEFTFSYCTIVPLCPFFNQTFPTRTKSEFIKSRIDFNGGLHEQFTFCLPAVLSFMNPKRVFANGAHRRRPFFILTQIAP